MIAVEDVQRAAMAAREFDALLHRHHVVSPPMDNGGGAIQQFLAQWRQPGHGERGRHEEHAACVQQ
jgi:hypothetical protein